MIDEKEIGDKCWYCGGKLEWDSDFNYDEVHERVKGL